MNVLINAGEYKIQLDVKYDNARQFYIKIPAVEVEGRGLPPVFTNIIRRKNYIECQTLELMKRNSRVRWIFGHRGCALTLADQSVASRSHPHE